MKITRQVIAHMADDARALTDGAYGMMESSRPGRPATITDVKADIVWQGPDYLRQAAAFYAGIVDLLTATTPPETLRVLAEVRTRHGQCVNDGRNAARDWATAKRGERAGAR
jgi:hypothetical protein